MKRIAIIAAALLSALVLQAQAPSSPAPTGDLPAGTIMPAGETFLEPLIQRDSALVADPFAYGFVLKDAPRGAQFALPDLSKGFGEGLETSGVWQVDSLLTKKQRKALAKGEAVPVDIRISTVVIPFEEGLIQLPPLAVQRTLDGVVDTLVFDPQVLDIRPMPVDTATFVPHDLKGQIGYPLTLQEVLPWIEGFDALAILVIAIVCLVMTRRRKEEEAARKEPVLIVYI